MVNIIVSGATNPPACNGTYEPDGELIGQTRYKHNSQNYWLARNIDDAGFWISNAQDEEGAIDVYFYKLSNEIIGNWLNDEGTGTVVTAYEEAAPPSTNPNGTGGYGDEDGSPAKIVNLVTSGTGYGNASSTPSKAPITLATGLEKKGIRTDYIDCAYMGEDGVAVDVS
jgi:hypothetical protein